MPQNGSVSINGYGSLATNVSFDVYTGSSVEALTLVTRGTNSVTVGTVRGGTVLQIAAVADEATQGDVVLTVHNYTPFSGTPALAVPGNLLCEPSFEGTGLELSCWKLSTPSFGGGYVGERGGADGTTWIALATGVTMWQDVATVPGANYEIRFAYTPDFGAQSGKIRVRWNGEELGIADLPLGDGAYWHWADFTATATGATSRASFEIVEGAFGMDAFSVIPMSAPPVIITQPSSASTFAGAAASFLVGANGSPPLAYQWYFNTNALIGETAKTLTLNPVSVSNAGPCFVVVTNAYGAVTSAPATLVVESPTSPTIVLQPYSDAVAEGGFFALCVAAVGTPPLHYQWFFNADEILGATNREYVLSSVQTTNAGTYCAKVWNDAETVWSFPAELTVNTNFTGGGALLLCNEFPDGGSTRRAWIFDTDGMTRLSGPNYLAQLYAGPSLALIRPVGLPQPFQVDAGSNSYAGVIEPEAILLPTVPPAATAFVQIRVWESDKGATYEEARALGSKFGRSEILQIATGVMPDPPPLWGLQSFSLQAGLPEFVAGRIELAGREPDGAIRWLLVGQAGYRYAIEKRTDDSVWQPLMVLTNQTGTVLFSDPAPSRDGVNLYRARILE